ncbi:unnamed protein product (mitochondrion) [Plasmodiophora brassicae]|uniref:G-protein coupled receptors family 3 profile domain-containing protein n=1 Tax=Plasmodiophora brassicae TaxID=37360 RepID=A0A3P3YNX4_PLABS|nr:unnamed protein product [Plasmodiophora brassicae]
MTTQVVAIANPLLRSDSCACVDPRSVKIAVIISEPTANSIVAAFVAGATQAAADRKIHPLRIVYGHQFSTLAQAEAISSAAADGYTNILTQFSSSSLTVRPMPTVLSLMDNVRFGSVISGEHFLATSKAAVLHVGADNVAVGREAAERLLRLYPSRATNTVCLNTVKTLSNHDMRCTGWIAVMQAAGKIASELAVSDRDLTMTEVARLQNDGVVTALFVTGHAHRDAINVIRSAPGSTKMMVIPCDIDTVVASEMLSADSIVPFAIDTQPYLQGYLSVALMASYDVSHSAMQTRFFRTGPKFVDKTTRDLATYAARVEAGFPVCALDAASSPSGCYNRSDTHVTWVMNAASSNQFWSIVRSGMAQAALDSHVQVREYIDDTPTADEMAGEIDAIVAQEVARRQSSSQRSPNIGVVIAANAPFSTTHAAATRGVHADLGIPFIHVNKDLTGPADSTPYDTILFMSNYESGHNAADYIASEMPTIRHVTCLYEGVTFSSSRTFNINDRCLGALHGFSQRHPHITADYVIVDKYNGNLFPTLMAPFIANGTDMFLAGSTQSIDAAIMTLVDSGVFGIGQGKVTGGCWDSTPRMLEALNAGKWAFYMDQNPFLQGYVPNVLLLIEAITGGHGVGNALLPDPVYALSSNTTYTTLFSGPNFIRSTTPRVVNCSSSMPGVGVPQGEIDLVKSFPFVSASWPVCLLEERFVSSPAALDVIRPTVPTAMTGAVTAVSTLGAVVGASVLSGLYVYRGRPAVKAGSVPFMTLICVCCTAIFALSPLYVSAATAEMCSARMVLFPVLFTIVLASIFAKNLRLLRIFTNAMKAGAGRRQQNHSNRIVATHILAITIGTLLIVLLLVFVLPPAVVEIETGRDDTSRTVTNVCQYSETLRFTLYAYIGMVVVAGAVVSCKSWSIPDDFNEARYLGLALYVILFTFVVILPLVEMLRANTIASMIVSYTATFLATMVVMLSVTLPKLLAAHNNTKPALATMQKQQTGTVLSAGSQAPHRSSHAGTMIELEALRKENTALKLELAACKAQMADPVVKRA